MIIERTGSPTALKTCADIWLEASIKAHNFKEAAFWAKSHTAILEEYLPASLVYVAREQERITGFAAIREESLAALFVAPAEWGKGVGSKLLAHLQGINEKLVLTVYKSNARAVRFYSKHGFFLQCEQTCPHTEEPELLMIWRRASNQVEQDPNYI